MKTYIKCDSVLQLLSFLLLLSFCCVAISATSADYESRRAALGDAFNVQNERIEANIREWNRIKILEAAANRVADSNTEYLNCVLGAKSRDLLEPNCEATLKSLLSTLAGARDAVAKSTTVTTEKMTARSSALLKIEQRDANNLRQQAEAIEEQIALHSLSVICDGVQNLRTDAQLSTYLSAMADEKYRTALRISAQSKRLYTVGRLLRRNCPELGESPKLGEIESTAIGIAFAEAMFEPSVLAATACASPGSNAADPRSMDALARVCVDILSAVTESDIDDFRTWLTAFNSSVQQAACLRWIHAEFLADPTPLDLLRYTGLARRVGNTPCNFPEVPKSFYIQHKQGVSFYFTVSTILGLAGDRGE